MRRNSRLWVASCLVISLLALASVAWAGSRSLDRTEAYLGGPSQYKCEGSLNLNYLELTWKKGALDTLNYQVASNKDAKVTLVDVQVVTLAADGAAKILWKQSDEEKMGTVIDNFSTAQGVRKEVNKKKFFTKEVPFDVDSTVVRFVVDLKGKSYNVDWNLKKNEVKPTEVKTAAAK